VTSRFCPIWLLVGLLALAGCDDAQYAGPVLYRDSERVAKDLAGKPKLQGAVRKALADLYGADLRHITVPADSGLRDGGIYLADLRKVGEKLEPVLEASSTSGKPEPIEGGYALYRKHCLHCHGVAGAGDGPTAAFLFPRPRDYRPGIYKFTSTNPVNAKPSRDDLRKTLLYGLHGTSMPGFEAIMTPSQIEQVIDYMTFLSIRGETERYLIDEAMNADDKDAETALPADLVAEITQKVTSSWKEAETQVINPTVKRVEPTRESILRGRDYFLAANTTGPKLECVSCHGAGGLGNGPAFIDQKIFGDVVFREKPLDEAISRAYKAAREQAGEPKKQSATADPAGVARFLAENPAIVGVLRKSHALMADVPDAEFAEKSKGDSPEVAEAARKLLPELVEPDFRAFLVAKYDLWTRGSLDVWENPLRPASLIDGVYKGGRRPLDLYWRIAKGINGAKMPAHSNTLTEDQIWDVVNFVLALPDEPGLLKESAPAPRRPTLH